MQKLHLKQTTKQKLSPQQIQMLSLLQLSTADLQDRIHKELEENTALEKEDHNEKSDDDLAKDYQDPLESPLDTNRYKPKKTGFLSEDFYTKIISKHASWPEELNNQLALLPLKKTDHLLGKHLIGSLDESGYMRKSLDIIVNDMAIIHNIEVSLEQVEKILHKIQAFDPPGVAARNVQECLLLQLERKSHTPPLLLAQKILNQHFKHFSSRRYEKILDLLHLDEQPLFKDAIALITKLNPIPIQTGKQDESTQRYPDFIVTLQDDKPQASLYKAHLPTLKINQTYAHSLVHAQQENKEEKEKALQFVNQRITRAKWFIEAIQKRTKTLLLTMNAIVDLQKEFFQQGEEKFLKPIFLRDVAHKINMDISTVSRVVSQKNVQTDWGIYPLKYFFSEPIATTSGQKVSSRIVKNLLKELIKEEDKRNPYSDDAITKLINQKGYLVARRTVTKYREQLRLPVARLRKSI
ncbi:MAG: RNA polymerase factor sigma-54 [Bacteroidota bacterium]